MTIQLITHDLTVITYQAANVFEAIKLATDEGYHVISATQLSK